MFSSEDTFSWWRFIEAFLMAVDNGLIAEAARQLNLTAAGVAKRIHALESEIGTVLFTRFGRTTRLTEAGAAIVEHASILLSMRVISNQSQQPTDGATAFGRISIGIMRTFA
jgi:DNA-binding transcriptional LysR family regulator